MSSLKRTRSLRRKTRR